MAESFLFTFAERVLEKLIDLSAEETRLGFNVKSDLRKLKETMISVKTVLLDAERQQHHNEKLRHCMWKLKDIFYDAEDAIDDFKCEALRKQVVNDPNIRFKERFLSSCSFPLAFSFKMGHKIKRINRRLDELATEWNSFQLREATDNRRVIHRDTHSFVNSFDVIGRDEDKENIIDLLMKPGDSRNIPVIPIVGIGGLGKTTLAQLVYNDVRVTRYFPLKIWICVSDEFDLPRLLKLIIQSINKEEKCDDLPLEVLQNCVRSLLNHNFLLVLDDVWNEDREIWIGLRDLLTSMGGLSQSKIIVTTRSLKVASIMSSIPPYELKGLPIEDCLTLFTKSAFNDGDGRRYPNLMRTGEEIVKKCKGVPLAVRTLGSLLFSKTDESYWISIRDSEIWRLEQSENSIIPLLKLSYNHLPSHLQRCFAFLSLYKKDHIYESRQVIQLWMANGLLEPPQKKQEWEDVGDRYLNELLSRCLIQKEEEHMFFKFSITFKMHDLIHDLALDVSQKECKTVTCLTETVDENVRHLSFSDYALLKVPEDLKKLKHVRTVIIQKDSAISVSFEEPVLNLCVSNFKYLRALNLGRSGLRELNLGRSDLGALPNSIGTLKHLRDLDLSYTKIEKLPSSFYMLRSLQRLSMLGIPLKQLPDSVQSLIELRYLEITIDAKHLKEIRPGCWPSLQYLGLFLCFRLECLPEGMQYLTSLRRLTLDRCFNLISLPRSQKFLSKLEDLSIQGCYYTILETEPEEEEDKDLQFSLKTFSLGFSNETDLPRLLLEGSSSTLQQISIEKCPELVVLPVWLQNLTSLCKLVIIACPELSALPEGMDRFTRLRQLIIKKCPKLSKRYRRDGGADWNKIAHIEEVVITDDD